MSAAKKMNTRATIYLDNNLHKAVKLKAVEVNTSVSDLINEALENYLEEDALDLLAFDERKKESTLGFAEFVKQLKADGKL